MNLITKIMLMLVLMTPICFGQDVVPVPEMKITSIAEAGKEPNPAPSQIYEGKMARLMVHNAPKDARFIFDILPIHTADADVIGNQLRFTSKASQMPFYIRVWVITEDKVTLLDHSLVINDRLPEPKPDDPIVDPVDPPKPPTPKTDEFRVLVLTEMDDVGKLSPSQAAALFSGKFYDFLNENCVKDKDNRPDWRFLDDDLSDAEIAKMEPYWGEAYRKAKADSLAAGTSGKPLYPWVVFSNPAKPEIGEAGPFPKTPELALEAAKKWAPSK
jgi:hypothetical protein